MTPDDVNSSNTAAAEAETAGAVTRDERFTDEKCREMYRLLIECRDAIPAIPLTSARLRGIDLTLADRIDSCLEPWVIHPDDPRYKDAI